MVPGQHLLFHSSSLSSVASGPALSTWEKLFTSLYPVLWQTSPSNSGCYGKITEEKVLSNLSLLYLWLNLGYKGPTEVKHHLSPCWGCPLYQNSSLTVGKVKSPNVEWMPPRDKRSRTLHFSCVPTKCSLVSHTLPDRCKYLWASLHGHTSWGADRAWHTVLLHHHMYPPSPAKDLQWESEQFAQPLLLFWKQVISGHFKCAKCYRQSMQELGCLGLIKPKVISSFEGTNYPLKDRDKLFSQFQEWKPPVQKNLMWSETSSFLGIFWDVFLGQSYLIQLRQLSPK